MMLISSKEYFSEMVTNAFLKRNLDSVPVVKDYLVSLLEHYINAENLRAIEESSYGVRKDPTLAEQYLTAINEAQASQKKEKLKSIADRTLYICGFFGDSFSKKIIDIEYYADIGGSAYSYLASSTKIDTEAYLFKTYSTRFFDFVEVLSTISHQAQVQGSKDLLRIYERYLKTGSETAQEILLENGIVTVPQSLKKVAQQD